jgi:hypothetical protein
VGPGREADLEVVFGPSGIWSELLARATGYIETKVARESEAEGRYRVQDFWLGHRNFEVFRKVFAAEYEAFELLLKTDGLVAREQFVGAYYEKHPGDEDELVPG